MILITAHGRLAHQPELTLLPSGTRCCEFRLLSTRFSRGEEYKEGVTFFCYGETAERFCDNTERGQLMSVTGTQETQTYLKGEETKHFVKYKVTWFEKGPKPNRAAIKRPAAKPAPRAPCVAGFAKPGQRQVAQAAAAS